MKISKGLDTLLSILSTPNWVSPLIGIGQEIAHVGDSETIVFDRQRYSINNAKYILKRARIKCWNDQIIDGIGYVSVSKQDASRARQLLS